MANKRKRREKIEFPALRRKIVVDAFRGQMRVRAWPRKRGPAKGGPLKLQQDWFAAVTQIIKFAPASQIIAAMKATKGTGLYPRDLLMRAISSGLVDLHLDDGTILTHRGPSLETVVFQGASLKLAVDLAIPAGTPIIPNWPLPVIDTSGFWNVATPDRLTIPNGVEVVAFNAGGLENLNPAGVLYIDIRDQAGVIHVRNWSGTGGGLGSSASTGPIKVSPGDWFQAVYWRTAAGRMQSAGPTFFGVTVLGTS